MRISNILYTIILAFVLILVSRGTMAQDNSWHPSIAVNLVSHHFDKKENYTYNETNPGLGVEFDNGVVTGFYENSYNKTTVYLGYAWRPIEVGPVKAGVVLGAASGYDLPVMAAASVKVNLIGGVSAHVVVAPSTPKASGFAALQMLYRF